MSGHKEKVANDATDDARDPTKASDVAWPDILIGDRERPLSCQLRLADTCCGFDMGSQFSA